MSKNEFLDGLKSFGVGILFLVVAIGFPILFGETIMWTSSKYPETMKGIVISFPVIGGLILVYEIGKEIRNEIRSEIRKES